MAVNKVEFGDETLIDLTQDTATADDVAEGKTFHLASGIQTVGTGRGGMSLVNLRGPVSSTSALPTTAPSDELWLVGTVTPYTGYFYNGTSWESVGTVSVGPPGPQGEQGEQGEDGFSPVITTSEETGGCFITITDATGTETVFIANGATGPQGQQGPAGADGADGADGVSPDVTITTITGGHRVTITDADHPQGQSFDVMDGSSQGGLPAGGSTRDFLIKSSNTDYDAQWASVYSSSTPAMDGTGSAGISSTFSRSDHVHPTDTTRQAKITASGILKGNGSGGVSAAVAGTDYLTPATNYSPVQKVLRNQTYALTVADVGKTFWEAWSSDASMNTVTWSLTAENSANMPVGAEIAFTYIYVANGYLSISGVRCLNVDLGEFATKTTPATVKFEKRSMIALKKLETSGAGDVWLLTGNAEVVS